MGRRRGPNFLAVPPPRRGERIYRSAESEVMTRTIGPAVFAAALLFGCGAPQTVEECMSTAVEDPRLTAAEKSDRSRDSVKTNERACAAAQYRTLVGRPIDEIDTGRLPRPLRIHAVDDSITMDHLPNRLNIVVGADGHVVAVKCG